jgi:hypothetical protein
VAETEAIFEQAIDAALDKLIKEAEGNAKNRPE